MYHFGINKQLTKKLTAGIRAKIYSSMFSYRSTNNRGSFVTRLGDGDVNIYEHTLQDVDVTVETSGYTSLRELDGSGEVISKVLGRAFFGGNIGVGVDLGATYTISDKLTAPINAIGANLYKIKLQESPNNSAEVYAKEVKSYTNTKDSSNQISLLR